jgi:TetR/AcrR family transcriptional regulator, transcriptional repressor for nem operon
MKENDKRYRIIDAGLKLLDLNGYNGTGISDILNETNIPKGSFYHYFKSKEVFTGEVISRYEEYVKKSIGEMLLDESVEPLQRIRNLYKGYTDSYIRTSRFAYGGFASKLNHEVGDKSKIIRDAANKVFNSIKEAHIHCLEQAVSSGEIHKDIDAGELAELIIYAWEGAILRMRGSSSIDSLLLFAKMLDEVLLRK